MPHSSSPTIDRYNIDEISPFDFYGKHLEGNRPCIFNRGATKSWTARREWTKQSGAKEVINYEKLTELFGDEMVPVVDCSRTAREYEAEYEQMRLADYLKYMKSRQEEPGRGASSACLYLKDWHLHKSQPDYDAYLSQLPPHLSSDWMNEYWDGKADAVESDYRFTYIGVKHSWTPFHTDVLKSFSWSANIVGRKLWYILPEGLEQSLLPPSGTNDLRKELLLLTVCTEDDRHSEKQKEGSYNNKLKDHLIQIIQEPGEIMFIPSGWHHQVHNLEDTISINHNWFNAANIDRVWAYVSGQLALVRDEIADSREIFGETEWTKQCQIVLKADIGINVDEFRKMLLFIDRNRRNRKIGEKYESTESAERGDCSRHNQCQQQNIINEMTHRQQFVDRQSSNDDTFDAFLRAKDLEAVEKYLQIINTDSQFTGSNEHKQI